MLLQEELFTLHATKGDSMADSVDNVMPNLCA